MNEVLRKKSPRAPSIPLDEAIERTLRVYEKEKRHPTPTEVVAQDIGYKSANNGAALAVLASLRYYGLLERPEDGKLSVSKDVENYQYSPDEKTKRGLLLKWLRTPQVFADLLDRYPGGLPSDANLRFDLINRGFSPPAAECVISVFRRSAGFANLDEAQEERTSTVERELPEVAPAPSDIALSGAVASRTIASSISQSDLPDDGTDKIPVRLSGGRRAWLIIPTPFYESDKARLKAQIDLLLCEDLDELSRGREPQR
jgi:hypothetical protein